MFDFQRAPISSPRVLVLLSFHPPVYTPLHVSPSPPSHDRPLTAPTSMAILIGELSCFHGLPPSMAGELSGFQSWFQLTVIWPVDYPASGPGSGLFRLYLAGELSGLRSWFQLLVIWPVNYPWIRLPVIWPVSYLASGPGCGRPAPVPAPDGSSPPEYSK